MDGVDLSPITQLERHARFHPTMTAIAYEGTRLSYRELYAQAGRLATALREDGVGSGDRVSYAGLNSVTFFVTLFATMWVGAAFVPLNFRLAAAELRPILEDARPDVLISEPAQAHTIDGLLGELAIRRTLVVDDDRFAVSDGALPKHWGSFAQFRQTHDDLRPHARQHGDDLAALLYTSGTTGRSKGVMLTHGNLWWNWVNVDAVVDTRFGDVNLAVAPLFHIGGLNALTLRTLVRGGTVVLRRTFDPEQALEDLVAYKVTTLFLVPAMLAAIQARPGFEDADLTSLHSTIAAAAPVPPSLITAYAEKGVLVQQAWGLTETAPFATYLEAAHTADKLGSCGSAMPYTEVQVRDTSTLDPVVGVGATGEFWVRGPNVSPGYWNNPEATASAFTADGWFRTGDIGYLDDDGYFFIVDRLKDMVISGGENIYPAELENLLNGHPGIDDVAVIGVPDQKWGEAVCAVVVYQGDPLSLEEIRAFCSRSLARYKLPSRLVVVETLPRNGPGKLDKPAIRRLVADLDPRLIATLESPAYTETVRVPRRA